MQVTKRLRFSIIHGTADKTVPVTQGDALHRTLREAGAKDVTNMKIEGAGHGVFNQHSRRTEPAMREFFDRVLQPTDKHDSFDNTQ
jgi:alpha-beta hydrolase superfamily lysophospholipase